MKLKRLVIRDFKGFVDFETTFSHSSPITTVIGVNGVGKSNLIEIIVSIFRAIDLGEAVNFSYKLHYECRGHDISVVYLKDDKKNSHVIIDGESKSFSFLKKMANEYLPLNIFTYYSGTNERVEELFTKHQTRFYNSLTNGDDALIRRFFYCRDVHSFFVLLAFLVDDDPACKEIIDKLGIKSLNSVLFILKKPYWYKNKPSQIMLDEGDHRFWYSRGVVRDFLATIWKYSIAPIDNQERKIIDFRGRSENQERLYLFLPNEHYLRRLANEYYDTTTFFKHLESTYIADLLEGVEVTVTLKNGHRVTFEQLSEGERQLLTVLGLIKFTRNDESLFLLDEPDTHLNPRWKLDYFDRIKSVLNHKIDGGNETAFESSQILLTTHDPLMLTSLSAEQVRVLSWDKEKGNKISEPPTVDPHSMGVEAIIQSDLYGIRTSLDKEVQNKIDLRNRLLASLAEGDEIPQHLIDIDDELDQIGLSQAHPNPYFSNFAKTLARNHRFRKPTFLPEEYEQLQEFTDDLLEKILSQGGSND